MSFISVSFSNYTFRKHPKTTTIYNSIPLRRYSWVYIWQPYQYIFFYFPTSFQDYSDIKDIYSYLRHELRIFSCSTKCVCQTFRLCIFFKCNFMILTLWYSNYLPSTANIIIPILPLIKPFAHYMDRWYIPNIKEFIVSLSWQKPPLIHSIWITEGCIIIILF